MLNQGKKTVSLQAIKVTPEAVQVTAITTAAIMSSDASNCKFEHASFKMSAETVNQHNQNAG
jgi:hypothetical protein